MARFLGRVTQAFFCFFLASYISCMIIYPWVIGESWSYVQKVWLDWQSLNVGVIALVSSVVALYSAKYSDIKKSRREFTAERVFLPHALSQLCNHLESVSELMGYYANLRKNLNVNEKRSPPSIPRESLETIKVCVKYSEGKIQNRLVEIANELQIVDARVRAFYIGQGVDSLEFKLGTVYKVVRLRALIDSIFLLSRGETELLDPVDINKGYKTLLFQLGIEEKSFPGLKDYIEKKEG